MANKKSNIAMWENRNGYDVAKYALKSNPAVSPFLAKVRCAQIAMEKKGFSKADIKEMLFNAAADGMFGRIK